LGRIGFDLESSNALKDALNLFFEKAPGHAAIPDWRNAD